MQYQCIGGLTFSTFAETLFSGFCDIKLVSYCVYHGFMKRAYRNYSCYLNLCDSMDRDVSGCCHHRLSTRKQMLKEFQRKTVERKRNTIKPCHIPFALIKIIQFSHTLQESIRLLFSLTSQWMKNYGNSSKTVFK